MIGSNWSGTHDYRARRLHRPGSVEELREIVARAPRVRVLGSRHSFTDIADSDELISLDALPADIAVEGGSVSFAAGLRYGELAEALQSEALALHNLASLPHISVAGAVATATHGSGDANGNLATAVVGARARDLRAASSCAPRAATRTSTAWWSAWARSAR